MSSPLHFPLTSSENIAQVSDRLRAGAIGIITTDTLPGFSACASNEKAVITIARIKGSPDRRQFVWLAADADMAFSVTETTDAVQRQLRSVWPAGVTAIMSAASNAPEWAGSTIAIRVPDDKELRRVIAAVGEPIVSTSVNPAGETPLWEQTVITTTYGERVDFTAGSRWKESPASTIVDLTEGEPVVVRAGAYAWTAGSGKPSNE